MRPNAPFEGDVYSQLVERMLLECPELASIDFRRAFATEPHHLTAGFLGRLQYELSATRGVTGTQGVVPTPPILAVDMVRLATTLWLSFRIDEDRQCIADVVWGDKKPSPRLSKRIRAALEGVRWYDPCLGGGVFPVAILHVLGELGLSPSPRILSQLSGGDIDPLAVFVSRIRVLLALASSAQVASLDWRDEGYVSFRVGDSLKQFSETILFDVAVEANQSPPSADIVVGNPPYVRADRLTRTQKDFLRHTYPSIAGGSVDLYAYFIAHGLISLKADGVLCYVSPASFQRSRYGKSIREFISRSAAVKAIFDFGELPIFNGADLHASVYAIQKGSQSGPVAAHAYQNLPTVSPFFEGLRSASAIPTTNVGPSGWYLGRDNIDALLGMLRASSVPLTQYAGEILSGIKTGHSSAYLLTQSEADEICSDPRTRQYVVRLLRPVSIRAWHNQWDGSHLAWVQKGEVIPDDCVLMQRFKRFEAALRSRTDVRGHPTWYGLRECAYYKAFSKPKIVFPDIATECRFAVDEHGFFIPDGAFMMSCPDPLLVALLNSSLAAFYFRARCSTIGNPHSGGRLRFKKSYVEEFPVPAGLRERVAKSTELERISVAIASGQGATSEKRRLDELVLDLYDVPTDYRGRFLETA